MEALIMTDKCRVPRVRISCVLHAVFPPLGRSLALRTFGAVHDDLLLLRDGRLPVADLVGVLVLGDDLGEKVDVADGQPERVRSTTRSLFESLH